MLAAIPFDDALTLSHDWDAWFTPYHIPGASEFPRLNIPVVAEIKARGSRVLIQYFCIDWDNPGHGDWTADLWDAFESKLEELQEIEGPLRDYYVVYTTQHGARIIYALEEPIPVSEAAGLFGGLHQMFNVLGIVIDEFDEWNRLYRLPRVTRDGKKSWEHDFFYMELPRKTLDPSRVPNLPRAKQHDMAAIQFIDGDMPSAQGVDELLYSDRAKGKWSPWRRTAKRYLQGCEYFEILFGNDSIPDPENPHLLKYVGSVTGLLIHRDGASPEGIFALFYRAVSMWERNSIKEPPLECLWRMIKTCWEREFAQREAEIRDKATVKPAPPSTSAPVVSVTDDGELDFVWRRLLSGWKQWAKIPDINTAQELCEFFTTRMIAVSPDGQGCYVMQPTGWYAPRPVPRSSLIAEIRRLRMDDMIQTRIQTSKNTDRWATATEIVNAVGYPVRAIRGRVNASHGSLLEQMETEQITLVENLFNLSPDIEAIYDEEVDTWLQKLGGKRYDKLTEWLGHSLDFSHPICALFIEADPGVGKKMMLRGLIENLAQPISASVRELTGRFQENLLNTPFVNCNEGFPLQGRGDGSTKAAADTFRELIAGDEITLDRKNRPLINVQIPYRVLLFANNRKGIEGLYAGQNLTKADRLALNQRLLHIPSTNAAAVWLTQKGNRAFTAAEGRRWIAGDAGEPSDHIVAQHFRWLYEHRDKSASSQRRFLVEGEPNSQLIMDMTLNSGSAPKVMTVLLGMLSNDAYKRSIKRLTVENEVKGFRYAGFYVTVDGVWNAQRTLLPQGERKATQNAVGSVLGSMSREVVRPREDGSNQRLRWYRLDCELLMNEADRYGIVISTDVLNDMQTILDTEA